MLAPIERAVLLWLRRVAPPGWPDAVEGDLNEERETGARRVWTLVQVSRIASRFTADALAARWRARHYRQGRRTMTIGTDIRHAIRSLLRSPGFSAVAVVTLALAIGANTAIYSALSAIVLQPLSFKDGNRYVILWHKSPDMGGVMITPALPAIEQWRKASHVFERVDSYPSENFLLTGTGEPEDVTVSFLQSSTLAAWGVAPALGRTLVQGDHADGAAPVLLISHEFWHTRFGGDPGAVGRTMTLGKVVYTIVGVMPRRFQLPLGSDLLWAAWRPGAMTQPDDSQQTLAKLREGVTALQAQTALDLMPDAEGHKGWRGVVITPSDRNGTAIKTALFVLTGAVGLLLVIACVNVANLMLSRQSARSRELAVRHALGASRGRLARYLMIESLILAVAGGAAGLAIAKAGFAAMAAVRPRSLDVLDQLRLEPETLIFTLAVTLATGLFFGAGPSFSASRTNLQDVLKSGGRSSTAGGQRVRAGLAIAQIAIALMLLVGAALLLRSYTKLTAVEPGYDPSGLVAVQLSLPSSRYPAKDPARRQAVFEQALAQVQSMPGVHSAAVGNGLPPETGITMGRLELEGRNEKLSQGIFAGGYVTPAYFGTLGIPVIAGRVFTADDTFGRDPVVIVNASFARKHWPNGSAVGAKLRLRPGAWSTIIGVVGDVKSRGISTEGDLQLYQARAQVRPGFGSMMVKAHGDPSALVPAIKRAIWDQDPMLPLTEVATARQVLSRSVAQWRFNLTLLASLAVCGVTLAIVGVYGVMSLYVGQRQREVGIRMALGASRAMVGALVMRQTAVMLGVSLVAGLGGAYWLSRYLKSLVFQTATTDAVSFAAAAAGIVVAAFAATIIPLRRATSVDPATVLRAE